ncbi:hypothetical protein HY639_00840 [Candidatus Woesearchaeota archaeon]|nr:hypothetical protein [Candidatus Woesearchaeota archaeon]
MSFLSPTPQKRKWFCIVLFIAAIEFIFVLTGVGVYLFFLGWILFLPVLLLIKAGVALSAANALYIIPSYLAASLVYWYLLSCVLVAVKEEIEK